METTPTKSIGTETPSLSEKNDVTDEELFKHVMQEFMNSKDPSGPIPMVFAAAGITTVGQILMLTREEVKELEYDAPVSRIVTRGTVETVRTKLLLGQHMQITFFKRWYGVLYKKYGRTTDSVLMTLYHADLNDFRGTLLANETPDDEPEGKTSKGKGSPQKEFHVYDPREIEIVNFKKGIKRDVTTYPLLTNQKHFDQWNRSVITQARSHDIIEVFTPDYMPSTEIEQQLFSVKQSFAYTVLNRCLQTDIGKSFVRQHEHDFDAQSVYAKLLKYEKESTTAELSRDDLIEFLATKRLDSSWRASTLGFILHWQEKMRLLDEALPVDEQYSLAVKRRMLEAAVRPIPALQEVRVIENNRVAAGGEPLDYYAYSELLMSAAVQYDKEHSGPVNKSKRVVAMHDNTTIPSYMPHTVIPSREEDFFGQGFLDAEYESFLSDTFDSSQLYNYAVDNQPNQRDPRKMVDRPFVPKEIWDQLPATYQQAIREHGRPPGTKGALNSSPNARSANQHDIYNDVYYDADLVATSTTMDGSTREQTNGDGGDGTEPDSESTELLALITQQNRLPAHDIRRVLSSAQSVRPTSKEIIRTVPLHRKTDEKSTNNEYHVSMHNIINYDVSASFRGDIGSLVDRGANGGIAGEDVRIIEYVSDRTADVAGLDNHIVTNLQIGTVAGVVKSQHGPVCLIMHQYAILGKGRTIHSCVQMEHYGHMVYDKSLKIKGGKQCIVTLDGYVLPLQVRRALLYLDMHAPSDDELENLPYVILTSDIEWNPSAVDSEVDIEEFFDSFENLPDVDLHYDDKRFDTIGMYRHRIASAVDTLHNDSQSLSDCVDYIDHFHSFGHDTHLKEPNYEDLRPLFAWIPSDIIKRTFEVTTRWARNIERYPFRKHYKSRFPALNVHRRNEPVATDTVFSDTPAIDNGAKCAQLFVGMESLVSDVYGMKTDREFVNTLEDNIRRRGAMDKLVSDRAQSEISNKVKDILRNFVIDDWQSEPYHQHQNAAERRYKTIKTTTNVVLDRTGAPAYTWLLAMGYVCYILNRIAVESLGWQTPLQYLTGSSTDISAILRFQFWEPVYYATDMALDSNDKVLFPSTTAEAKGRFVGFSEHVGDALTYKILTDDDNKMKKIIHRSYVRSALDDTVVNRRITTTGGVPTPDELFDDSDFLVVKLPDRGTDRIIATFSPEDIINRTYLTDPDETGKRLRAKIVSRIIDKDNILEQLPENIRFVISLGEKDNIRYEVAAYNDIIDHLENEMLSPEEQLWNFQRIIAHEGPLKPTDSSYKGSNYNVLVLWEDGSQTYEPLHIIAADSPVTCAKYALENNLLELPGWRRFRTLAKKEKKLLRQINQAHLTSIRRGPIFKFGFRVPRTPIEAVTIDKENANTNWQDAIATELMQLHEYNTFKEYNTSSKAPEGYKKINVHFVFDVKHDGRHKARLVAGGHLTEVPLESVYSGVVSLRSLRMVIFLAELNGLEIHGADVGNAYLEAWTKEKVYIIAPPGFGDLEGHTLIIQKALYGLRSSGLRWHERLADCLIDMGFEQSKGDPDVWMRRCHVEDVYEYIAVYVDDLAIAAKNPSSVINTLMEKYKFKLKGIGPLTKHLGCDYGRDPDGTLFYGPQKYIQKAIDSYEKLFKEKPKLSSSPLEKNDHPELDVSKELNAEQVSMYQSLIGSLQWITTLGRFDILTSVMSMSRFRVMPREGHLSRLKRIFGYLRKFDNGAIRVRTSEPDYSDLPSDTIYDWTRSVYGNVQEDIADDIPKPLGNRVVLTTYVDANLYHDMISGRSVTGILHLMNSTPIDWYSKRQGTVETATYGSEFVAARIATDQVIDIRHTLRYFGVPIAGKTYLFGDNESVITSSTIPHSLLNKRHNALAYHRVREAIAAGVIRFTHIDGKINPADIVSKHCGYPQLMSIARPLLFWRGNTEECPGYKKENALIAMEGGRTDHIEIRSEIRSGTQRNGNGTDSGVHGYTGTIYTNEY